MDWLTFFATVIGHLAWPTIAGAFLYLARHQIEGLAERVEEITVPGGGRAKFLKALAVGRERVEAVAAGEPSPSPQIDPPDRSNLQLANDFPEAAVLEAYSSVEAYLLQARNKLNIAPRTNLQNVLREMVKRNLIDAEVEPLFQSLRRGRNAAAHGSSTDRITSGEAADYLHQAAYLRGYISAIVESLPR